MLAGTFENQRRGTVSVGTLLAVPALLILVGLVIYVGTLRDARTETQNGADAAALAAARALATDDLLTDDLHRATQRLRRARTAAIALGQANFAGGERLELDENAGNDPDGDIVFGQLDRPLSGHFEPIGKHAADCVGDRVNAVRVTLRRGPVRASFGGCAPERDVLARATAMLDWRVVGFRPKDDSQLPLIPIGICTDHKGELPHGWDAHCRRRDRDEWHFDHENRKCLAGRDGIPEVTVILGQRSNHSDVPGVFLKVGVHTFDDTVEQVRSGMNRGHFRGQFGDGGVVLGPDNALHIPGTPDCPGESQPTRRSLDEVFRGVCERGEARIWPLFSEVDEDSGLVRVTGWMAARVVGCDVASGGGIKLTLQPAVVCHPAAVTEHRSSPPAFWAINRTICRVRLAE
jgi:hypothetical protein